MLIWVSLHAHAILSNLFFGMYKNSLAKSDYNIWLQKFLAIIKRRSCTKLTDTSNLLPYDGEISRTLAALRELLLAVKSELFDSRAEDIKSEDEILIYKMKAIEIQ